MRHTAMDFVIHFEQLLDHLDQTMEPKYREVIFRYRFLDPHDLVNPDDLFSSKNKMIIHLRNLIWLEHINNDPSYRN